MAFSAGFFLIQNSRLSHKGVVHVKSLIAYVHVVSPTKYSKFLPSLLVIPRVFVAVILSKNRLLSSTCAAPHPANLSLLFSDVFFFAGWKHVSSLFCISPFLPRGLLSPWSLFLATCVLLYALTVDISSDAPKKSSAAGCVCFQQLLSLPSLLDDVITASQPLLRRGRECAERALPDENPPAVS